MSRSGKSGLVLLLLSFGTAEFAMAAVNPVTRQPEKQPAPTPYNYVYSEGKQDPQGLLNQQNLETFRELASKLSSDRSWLTGEVLKGLSTMRVYLDEVFPSAPKFVEVDGKLYRVVLEKVGDGWQDFNPRSSKYLLFLNHEVYDALGENYALGFEGGKERVLVEDDLAKVASIGLTLRGITPDEKPKGLEGIASIKSPIKLGKVQPRLRGPFQKNPTTGIKPGVQADTTCSPISAPVACSNSIPVCSSSTASPYFVLTSLKIKEDHEGLFKGDPETELFPLRVNMASPIGGSSDVRTNWIFDGRYVTDLAGRSVYLPDVENTNQWYSVSGLALFPSSMQSQWIATLVENDDTTGLLELDRDRTNPIKLEFTYDSTKKFDFFDLLKSVGQFVLTLAFQSDTDDLWVESLEVNNNKFCSAGVGYPYGVLYDSSEWSMQGHFACIDPACVPPPPVYEGGGGCLEVGENLSPCQ